MALGAPRQARRTDPKRAARGTAEARPKPTTRKERKAERKQGKARKGGLAVRVLAIAIPVAAFAAAFILGAGSRPHDPAPARLATGSAQHGSATVASMATVPAPAKLVVQTPPGQEDQEQARAQGRDGHALHRHVGAVERHAAGLASGRRSDAPRRWSPPKGRADRR